MKIDFDRNGLKLIGFTLVLGVTYGAIDFIDANKDGQNRLSSSFEQVQTGAEHDDSCDDCSPSDTFNNNFDGFDDNKSSDSKVGFRSCFKLPIDLSHFTHNHFLGTDIWSTTIVSFYNTADLICISTDNVSLHNYFFTSLASGNKAGPCNNIL
jgi:hypothetical protein